MLSFAIFCHVWFQLTDLICCVENSTGLEEQSFGYVDGPSSLAVTQFSVPEDHHICLSCDGSFSSDVIWTFQDRKVLVSRDGSYQTNQDHQRYCLQTDGSFCLLKLDDSDQGEYHCNQKLVAELQVLSGHDFRVSAGRTLLLPCSGSSRPKQRWFRQRGEKREAIFTRFRNGTEKRGMDGSQLSYTNDALQIQNLQPEDAGEYLCNGVLQAKVTVLTVQPEATSTPPSTSTTPVSAVTKTDVDEIQNETKKRPENALLLIAVVGLGLMIILMAAVCALLTSMKCKRKKKYKYAGDSYKFKSSLPAAAQRHEDTELQLWRTSNTQNECEVAECPPLEEETIHYASLGRQNWRERPNWSSADQSPHSVIYSSVITGTAARNMVS